MIARSTLAAGERDSSENQRLADLQAAAMLRMSGSVSFDADTESDLSAIAAEMNLDRLELIRLAVGQWLALRKGGRFPTDDSAPVVAVRSDICD
ncbi:hypothetical protein LB572_11115 [Mesorhizobium sp. BH1-1-5]|uniref:hypothetical protein n=1 Tax=unclassified Mesorhizobium TaxID=325217 RepID=UPI00112B382C|nr:MULTISPECIES: hypothetical protein [unclassified Mesorhizobium]MBZ9987647.1 hypothetical protein [Mesorhizobium sp. BH1-1-5]TPJ56815.1 hypothetical protein FJ471_23015 [Mesorhizobium sp. B2-7-1]